jgi:hypothetical protein
MTETAARAAAPGAADRTGGGSFDDLPPDRIVRAFGVEYAHLRPAGGGDLYLTRLGWACAPALLPERWYADQWYEREGARLRGATGTVYHVRPRPGPGRPVELIVKFSRVAQEVPLLVDSTMPVDVPPEVIAAARFNSPLEEFGLVMELRRGAYGPPGVPVRAQRPLAIYVPPEEFDLWQLGRHTSSFHSHRAELAEDQADAVKAIEFDIRRIYVLLYEWIEGRDAEDCFHAGMLDEPGMRALSLRVGQELETRGFMVLDNKPKHFILRPRPDGSLVRHADGRLAYGLVDFELLQRTPAHQAAYKAARRERYWELMVGAPGRAPAPAASHLRQVNVFGVEYSFGETPDGGRLWVVGHESGLFDYFLPDRWRRTPREKLSAAAEVYRTRTRDRVDIVYRRSRVGFRPLVDPRVAGGRRIREAGYNSPFEEVALAGRLREMGVHTIHPRAIYETAHETVKSQRLRDPRRFVEHADVLTPESPPRPALQPEHDYYTLWDTYLGAEPLAAAAPGGVSGVLGLERARETGVVSAEEADEAIANARRGFSRTALPPESIAPDEFVVALEPDGRVAREGGHLRLFFSLDALTAFDCGLLPEDAYLALMERMDERLRAVDYEKLDPNGRHLLLTVDSNGQVQREHSGEVHAVLCSFAFIRGLYRPIR